MCESPTIPGLGSLEQINAVRVFWEDFFFFFLQMEIVHHMVFLKTLISAELFITMNVAERNVSAVAKARALWGEY